jgi:integrase
MATLRLRGNIYYLDYRLDGERFVESTHTSDWATAEIVRKDTEAKITLGLFGVRPAKKKNIALSKFIEIYFDNIKSVKKPSTIKNERSAAKIFLNMAGDKNIRDYTLEMLEKWRAKILEKDKITGKTKSPAYFNALRRNLHVLFNNAITWEYLDKNPFDKLKKLPEDEQRLALEDNEGEKIFDELDKDINDPTKIRFKAINIRYKHLFNILLNTGMRLGEALSLDMAHIVLDPEEGKIMVVKTKTKKNRDIPIIPIVRDSLMALGPDLLKGIRPFAASHRFKSLCRRAGLEEHFKLHSLRHTFATNVYIKTGDIYAVQKLLGHSDIRTTLRYVKASLGTLRKAIYMLDETKKSINEI